MTQVVDEERVVRLRDGGLIEFSKWRRQNVSKTKWQVIGAYLGVCNYSMSTGVFMSKAELRELIEKLSNLL